MQVMPAVHLGMPRLPQRMEVPNLGMPAVERLAVGEGMEMLVVAEGTGRERVMDGLGVSRLWFAMVVLEK